jgi:DNA polymerase I
VALKRAREQELAAHLEQDIKYVAVNDEKSLRGRLFHVREEIATYDASYYDAQLDQLSNHRSESRLKRRYTQRL